MIKLFSLKQQKKEGEGAKTGTKRASAAQLRITKGAVRCGFAQRSSLFIVLPLHHVSYSFWLMFRDLFCNFKRISK